MDFRMVFEVMGWDFLQGGEEFLCVIDGNFFAKEMKL